MSLDLSADSYFSCSPIWSPHFKVVFKLFEFMHETFPGVQLLGRTSSGFREKLPRIRPQKLQQKACFAPNPIIPVRSAVSHLSPSCPWMSYPQWVLGHTQLVPNEAQARPSANTTCRPSNFGVYARWLPRRLPSRLCMRTAMGFAGNPKLTPPSQTSDLSRQPCNA